MRYVVVDIRHRLRESEVVNRQRTTSVTPSRSTTSATSSRSNVSISQKTATSATQPAVRVSAGHNRLSNAVLNAAVRNSAVPVPRVSPPTVQALPKICWFHRQFGQASVNCLQPCEFRAPNVVVPHPVPVQPVQSVQPVQQQVSATPKPQISSVVVRRPLERNQRQLKSDSSSSSSDSW